MKKILIAGASSGIGQALAAILVSQGHSVISISRTKPDAGEYVPYDMTSQEPMPVIEGAFDGLVYCPGTINLRPFKTLKPTDFQKDFEINVLGAVKFIQQYLPNLTASPRGSIILFSTVASQLGMPYHTSIAASKGAVEGLAKALAAELAPKIRVNVIAPSLVKTKLASRLTDNETKIQAAAERHPLKRIGEPEDIANLAAFLLSDESTWITGQVMHVDGGMSSIKL